MFRPLIGSDKQEIIARAEEIGTFDISTEAAPDCCTLFMPRAPETHAKLRDVYDAEPICLSTSGPMKSWTRSRCTITVAPNRISARSEGKLARHIRDDAFCPMGNNETASNINTLQNWPLRPF